MADLSTVIGADTDLRVVRAAGVDLAGPPSDRRTARLVRRASHVVGALRDAGVRGSVTVSADGGSLLGLQAIQVRVLTGGDTFFVVVADTYRRGHVAGPLREAVRVAVPDPHDRRPGRNMSTGATWVDLDRGPKATRIGLLRALRSALAPQVWDEVTRELDKGRRVDLYRAESNGGTGLVVDTTGPAGQVVAHVEGNGHVHGLTQRTGSSWSRGEGAFGRFLTAEFRAALDVDHEHDVFVPFMDRLASTVRTFAGLAPSDHLDDLED